MSAFFLPHYSHHLPRWSPISSHPNYSQVNIFLLFRLQGADVHFEKMRAWCRKLKVFQNMQGYCEILPSFIRKSLFMIGFGFFNDFYLILIFRGSRFGSRFYDCNCTWLHFTFSRWILWQRRNCHFLHAFYLLFMDQKCQNWTNLLGSPMVSIKTYSNKEFIFFHAFFESFFIHRPKKSK